MTDFTARIVLIRGVVLSLFLVGGLGASLGGVSEVYGSGNQPKIDANATSFGEKITLEDHVTLDRAIKEYSSQSDRPILVEGKVKKVCKKMGCWMVIADRSQEVRVTFKDYGFFVPASLLNQSVRAQGQLVEKTISVEELRHFAQDEGKSKADIDRITKPKKVYRFVASGVEKLS